ncbi:Sodium/hydrogen exchanger family-domain-containing protein [Ephemerocybe angulata]|uniref:Sodium/hydrogen exchanger family-domain-containing protein n=1 Tax=Ephemerocybe angulata TaxID=980116 RepID=A0A8H6M8E2_9AGAR|nr:Sodium/hydrogen exchanger family-domain-containing protein [Tulosesus angulatus]
MPEFSKQVISLFQKRAAAEQGGLLSGKDPTAFNDHDPIRLWIIQVGIIICTANLLALGLRKMRQPKVIAEVLGGIILGPTAFGRIPGFTKHIFPQESRPYLSLVATIGLCLFLFLVGLEIDAGVIRRNARLSATVALAGMVVPFGLGAGLAVPIYERFIDPSVKFTHFMLFTGVAYSITAFPVLCRILTELKLLDTTVGIVVLSAGVGNDIIGWVLLALSVALVNAGSGLTALYILLVSVGWTLFILFPVRYGMKWLARKTGSIESGPSVFFMTVTIVILFGSAFFTDIIGVHAIFGAFLAGLVVPREGGLAIAMTEKLEDMVSIIFLPLYFTLSGLSTDLGLLNDGLTWGFTIAIIITAFVGKFGGCIIAARYFAGFNWREASTIGSLMSCKGLVELIVLNVGLTAGILSQRVFSMFVLEALVLTFATTPLVTWLYPPQFRVRIAATGANFNNVADGEAANGKRQEPRSRDGDYKTRFTVVLDKFEHLSGMMALTQLINPSVLVSAWSESEKARQPSTNSVKSFAQKASQVVVEALRVIELSDRVSAVMKSSAAESLLRSDPLLSAFRMFGTLNDIKIVPSLTIVKHDELAFSIVEHARNNDSDMIMLPWLPPLHDPYPEVTHRHRGDQTPTTPAPPTPGIKSPTHNPFDLLFKSATGAPGSHAPHHHHHQQHHESSASVIHSQFVRAVFSQATTDVALFVDQSQFGSSANSAQHLFLPFFGGPDDRAALELVIQLCENPRVSATVVRLSKRDPDVDDVPEEDEEGKLKIEEINRLTVASAAQGYPDTFYGQHNTETRLQSDTADNIVWAKYAQSSKLKRRDSGAGSSSTSSSVRSRVEFREIGTHVLLHTAVNEAKLYAGLGDDEEGDDEDGDGYVGGKLSLKRSKSSGGVAFKDTGKVEGQEGAPDQDGITEAIAATPRSPITLTRKLSTRSRTRTSGVGGRPGTHGRLLVVTGRSRRLAVEDHSAELRELMEEYGAVGPEVKKAIGSVASAFVVSGVGDGIVVLQAATGGNVD